MRRRPFLRAVLAVRGQWARRTPERRISAEVQGVRLSLPSTHPLRFYARWCPDYSQNLVDLAGLLAEAEGRLVLLDVGANVGDSTAQVHARVGTGSFAGVCVEPDPRWLPYLAANTADLDGTAVEPSLLAADAADAARVAVPHKAGTTQYLAAATDAVGTGPGTIGVDTLLERHPVLGGVRLVKSDTDGYDLTLATEYARVFAASHPVLFLEVDPRLTRTARPGGDPHAVWDELAAHGYAEVAVWDNFNRPVARLPLAAMRAAGESAERDGFFAKRYWDVAVVHRDDAAARAALDHLLPPRAGA